jgi:hypothetical protein
MMISSTLPQQQRPQQCRGAAAANHLPLLRHRQRAARTKATPLALAATASSSSPADPILSDLNQMQQAMRQFDRDMDSLFWGQGGSPFAAAEREMERAMRLADEELERAATTTTSKDGRVRVERSESRAPGAYRYYERIEVVNGGGGAWAVPQPATTAPPPPIALLAALITAGAYAALTAAFARNFDLTLYAARDKLRLALTWPVLLLTSKSFRSQFVTAVVRGERVRVTRPSGGGEGEEAAAAPRGGAASAIGPLADPGDSAAA